MLSSKIELEKLHNTRDLGGIETADGRHIKPHRLIRSGQICFASENDLNRLKSEYDLKVIADFRNDDEVREKPDPIMEGVSYVRLNAIKFEAAGITRDKKSENSSLRRMMERNSETYMPDMYSKMIKNEHTRQIYREFLTMLSEQKSGSVLWHCTAGKDRTGLAAVFILEILGVPYERILDDYLSTNTFIAPEVELIMDMIQRNTPGVVMPAMRRMLSADKCYLDAAYRAAEELAGSMPEYIEQYLGVDEAMKARLRDLYLE
ncbi:MAG: tyrosine-protein phosphatase [Eubacteriales bacterium]|nr:tyrosine-protein phosphatase [Eubacteriales bacterium]